MLLYHIVYRFNLEKEGVEKSRLEEAQCLATRGQLNVHTKKIIVQKVVPVVVVFEYLVDF